MADAHPHLHPPGHEPRDEGRAGHSHAGHAHDGHHHAGAPGAALRLAFALTAGFACVEGIGGWVAGSLALMSDAGHMITDAAALAVAMFAQHIARRPPSAQASYGYARAEVLAAFVNALVMLVIVGVIVFEAVHRLASPPPVRGGLVTLIALAGLVVNIVAALILARSATSLNTRAALLHVMGDLFGSVAAVVAGVVVATTGYLAIDPMLSLVISVLILRSTWRLLKETSAVLMEGVPAHLDYEEIGTALSRLAGVSNVHDLHIWHMGSDDVALSAHIAIGGSEDWPRTLGAAQRLLRERFGIAHVTLQPDWPMQAPAGRRVIPLRVDERDAPAPGAADPYAR